MGLINQLIYVSKLPRRGKTIQSNKDIDQLLSGEVAAERLDYVYNTISEINKYIPENIPLIGFAGAPWTILAYMIEGKGSKTFSVAKKFLYVEPEWSHYLLDKITDSTIHYLRNQVKAGVQTLQLFDSWAGILGTEQYAEFGMKYIEKIANELNEVPLTIFSKGAITSIPAIGKLNCNTVGLDWNMDINEARKSVGESRTLQGNLDPCALYASHNEVEKMTKKMMDSFASQRHIVNLGHGVYPDIDPEKVKTFIKTVKNYELRF